MRNSTPVALPPSNSMRVAWALGLDGEVGAGLGHAEVGGGGAPAAFVLGCGLVVAAAFLSRSIEVRIVGDAGLLASLQQGFGDFPFVRLVGHAQRAARTVVFIGAAFIVLGFAEVGQDGLVVPAFVAELTPLVVIGRVAAHVDHAVDGTGAAQHLAPRLVHGAAVQFLFRFRLELPVHLRVDKGFRIAHRDVDPGVDVLAARLQQQHAVAARIQSAERRGRSRPIRRRLR